MSRKKPGCRIFRCTCEPYRGGLCKDHYEDDERRKQQRDRALNALHFGIIDEGLPTDPALREELERIRVYWDRAGRVLHTASGTAAMPIDEAKYATEWCIALANEIVEGQHAIAAGKPMPSSFTLTRQWVWERFRNLDAGLRSNGKPRA